MSKTLRMTFPSWQGGVNPNYVIGAQLLDVIAPHGFCSEVTIPVALPEECPDEVLEGVDMGGELRRQQASIRDSLASRWCSRSRIVAPPLAGLGRIGGGFVNELRAAF